MEQAGNKVRVRISKTKMVGASAGVEIKGVQSSGINEMADLLEVTAFGDEYKRRIKGLMDTEIPLKGYIITDDGGQLIVKAGDTVYVAVFPNGYEAPGVQVPMIIESVNKTYDVSGIQEFDASLKGNGAPETI